MKHTLHVLKFLIYFINFLPPISHCIVPQFQTTRLKSTAGAGVASLTVDEANSLNPAPLAFFNVMSLYVQRTKGGLSAEDGTDISSGPIEQNAVIISDTKGSLKGSAGYVEHIKGHEKTKQFSASIATIMGPQSSWGLTYKKTTDGGGGGGFEQFIVGITHVVSPDFSLGIVLSDPAGKVEGQRRGIVGLQYIYQNFISLMIDGGSDYEAELSENFFHREAVQIKLLGNIYTRFGIFNDKGLKKRGTGTGLSWIQPRLMLDFAVANTSYDEGGLMAFNQEVYRETETSFSLSYRF